MKLTASERDELRERLVSYMEYHPLPQSLQDAKTTRSTVRTESFRTVSLPLFGLLKGSAVAAALVLLVVPFMAERAVPGDTLYAVKVQFNEELRSTLTFDSYQKVEWETERLNRRIAEARLLASEGRLTEEVEVEVAEAVRTHTENAKKEIEALRAEDADEATIAEIALDTTLEVQSTSLRGEKEDGEESESDVAVAAASTEPTPRPTDLIANVIDESRAQSLAEKGSSTPPAYDKLMARVELNTTRIYELRDSVVEVAPESDVTEVNRRIEDLERSIAEAMELFETDELAARVGLVDVLQRSQRLIVFMTEIEVTETVDIDTLVPVVLTDAEKTAVRQSLTEELADKQQTLAERYEQIEDESLLEKASSTYQRIDALELQLASSTDFESFQTIAKEGLSLTDDMIIAIEESLAPQVAAPAVEETDEPATSTEPVEPESEAATTTPETTTSTTSAATSTQEETGTTTDEQEPAESPAVVDTES